MSDTTANTETQENPQIAAVKRAAAILRAAFGDRTVMLQAMPKYETISISVHEIATYAEGTEAMRQLGCGVRRKVPRENYTELHGESGGVTVYVYVNELPPTCRKVTKIERIPKTETRETGEFIEIEREVVVCGEGGANE